jgi:hypothetical protein
MSSIKAEKIQERGMENLAVIFSQLHKLLSNYNPPLVSKVDDATHFDLWSVKNLVIEGRKRKEVFFASIIIQKAYVGFYFMPVYVDTEIKEFFPPELVKLLKGKSCFRVKKLDEKLLAQIESALKIGFELYQDRGWV